MGVVPHVSVLCVFSSTMESSIHPPLPRKPLESVQIPSRAWREFNHDESRAAVFLTVPLRRECRGKRRKLKTPKHESLQQKQEKAPEPPENRDSRRKSNASRVGGGGGGGGVFGSTHAVIVYTHYDPNALIPLPRHIQRGY